MSKDWIREMKKRPEGTLKLLYKKHNKAFKVWAMSRFYLDEFDVDDLFQNTMIIFYDNVRLGKLETLESSVKTYLFAIGKNLALKRFSEKKNQMEVNVSELPELRWDNPLNIELNERQLLLTETLQAIGEPCNSILRLFYFEQYTMDSIATNLGYKNEHVVKSQKLRCLNKLKELLTTKKMDRKDL